MFKWSDFTDVADDLSRNPNEAYIRSSIARYYYSLFDSSREYLIKLREKHYLKKGGRDIHRKVKDELIKSDNFNEKEIGEILDDLRILRNKASYDKDLNDNEYFKEELNKIKKDIKIAFQSLNYLKNYPPINRRFK